MSYSGLFNDNNTAGYSLLVDKAPRRNAIKRVMNKNGFRELKELFDTLIGVAAGSTATSTYKRVANSADNAGLATIETKTDISRATTAADEVMLREMVVNTGTSPTFVADLSGNGGGAS